MHQFVLIILSASPYLFATLVVNFFQTENRNYNFRFICCFRGWIFSPRQMSCMVRNTAKNAKKNRFNERQLHFARRLEYTVVLNYVRCRANYVFLLAWKDDIPPREIVFFLFDFFLLLRTWWILPHSYDSSAANFSSEFYILYQIHSWQIIIGAAT